MADTETAPACTGVLRNLHRNLSFWVLVAGVRGYVGAVSLGDRS